MLKIKDDVDLKELEKFGFYKDKEGDYMYIYNVGNYYKSSKIEVFVRQEDRSIYSNSIGYTREWTSVSVELDIVIDKIYNLIQAGLVEKV